MRQNALPVSSFSMRFYDPSPLTKQWPIPPASRSLWTIFAHLPRMLSIWAHFPKIQLSRSFKSTVIQISSLILCKTNLSTAYTVLHSLLKDRRAGKNICREKRRSIGLPDTLRWTRIFVHLLNSDWKRYSVTMSWQITPYSTFLSSPHQFFVRQKNLSSSLK